ncbi:Re/Si-specific NAD(P)(+) transhydrogenase subunit alpha [Psittacicella gerlachiana]|uniref:NAD(P) transhydrogenase subunit alpha n=1 Tax=Psittacicella gerlachiana TaxID=2028574 RepID=A0A3A1YLN9_9GAMM|nr:Re/Si-specific NAD(P)(+) transhydrogenase subunit alpha [Psittacicella gerlachiana]RIY37910.1 NAD(P)(+) transhydrogenase (Re/Si-specific) subunit alpha [Psittacicella gerlachiana]
MQIGIRKEAHTNENRVALTPTGTAKLIKLGYQVVIETGAGLASTYPDHMYTQAGATVVSREQVYNSDIILAVTPPELEEVPLLKENSTLISFIYPGQNPALVEALQAKNITSLAMDMVPRISRAQAMDALSSLANIAGYRAVVEASAQFGRFLNGQITAAGKIAPAKVLVIGAGVAGLAAIGTAKNLGAIVRAFDARPEVKEQVESMGAQFLTIGHVEQQKTNDGYTRTTSEEFNKKSAELYANQAKEVDIIITTAAIPGRKAPVLLTKEMVDSMKPGSVIVDIAAATGGNCEYTQADQVVTTSNGVKVVGYTNYQSMLGNQASELYSNNLVNLLALITPEKNGEIKLDQEDVIVRNMLVTLSNPAEANASILYPPPAISVSASSKPTTPKVTAKPQVDTKTLARRLVWQTLGLSVGFLVYLYLTANLPTAFVADLNIFMLASVLGYFLIWNVHSALHTPLMSLTNALSGIVMIGAIYQINDFDLGIFAKILALIGVFLGGLNIFGGFAVTNRMLSMFIKKDQGGK